MESIIVANANADSAKRIAAVLKTAGLPVSGVCSTGAQIMNFTNKHYRGGLVVSSVKLLDTLAFELVPKVRDNYEFLFVLQGKLGLPKDMLAPCLTMPLNRVNLIASVSMMLEVSGGSSLSRRKRLESGNLDEAKLLERAKHLLMQRCDFTEASAHRFIQKKSMNTGKKMNETALIILETMEEIVS